MEISLLALVHRFLEIFALPQVGLVAIFMVSLVSATFLPLGSEPAVFGYVKLMPDMFWPAILVATLGNTVGGGISYAMGRGGWQIFKRWQAKSHSASHLSTGQDVQSGWRRYAQTCLHRMGPPALLFAWLPIVGDPLCIIAGWLRLAFWPCIFYMSLGKFARYVTLTWGALWVIS